MATGANWHCKIENTSQPSIEFLDFMGAPTGNGDKEATMPGKWAAPAPAMTFMPRLWY